MITNNDLKYYEKLKQKKHRDAENKFLIEGVHIIEECLKSETYRKHLEKIIVREDFNNEKAFDIIKNADHIADIEFLPESKFNKLSETVNSQGIIGVVSKPDKFINQEKTDQINSIVVAVENVNDPGNLGTIIRNCHWFGADELILSGNSVDIYNSKVIRSSQGSLFFVNIRNEADLNSEFADYRSHNYEIFVTDLNAENYIDDIVFLKPRKYVAVFGSESSGVSKSICDNNEYNKVKIRGFSDCESLNLAVATGIVLYKLRF
ncbi:MAG TPA: RNA methyltransferase [Ignavibacteria bacterium]|nr:RNA methyltransferase [Ignavibacteria bacterium]